MMNKLQKDKINFYLKKQTFNIFYEDYFKQERETHMRQEEFRRRQELGGFTIDFLSSFEHLAGATTIPKNILCGFYEYKKISS